MAPKLKFKLEEEMDRRLNFIDNHPTRTPSQQTYTENQQSPTLLYLTTLATLKNKKWQQITNYTTE
jgi:hypothetical protein